MRGTNNNNSVETVNAAATAIIAAESRAQQVSTLQSRKWGACFSMHWCFGSQRQRKRISHAVLVPEPTLPGSNAPPPENSNHNGPAGALAFAAPPSSPASFLQSEPTSSTQSPARFLSLSALSANAYSPAGPSSIFAIGPYANETQPVSPPVFSTFTTEPSTAPFTPPPEGSMHLTTPSSPEVPFAKLLSSSFNPSYEFQSYHLYPPGSPIGHLISPSSVCSGTSSPFPGELELNSSGSSSFPATRPPEILTAQEGLAVCSLVPRHSLRDNHGSILDGQISPIAPAAADIETEHNEQPAVNHRVSFELSAKEVARCMEKKPAFSSGDAFSAGDALMDGSLQFATAGAPEGSQYPDELPPSAALPAVKEFKFNNSDGASTGEPGAGSEWWVNEKAAGDAETGDPQKKWAFFPMIQPGVS